MAPRLELQALLETLVPAGKKVYFQPPSNLQMSFPCIVYARDRQRVEFADNHPYRNTQRYLVTVIDRDPDSLIPAKVAALPMSIMARHYTADGLHHDAFTVYF